LITNPLLKKSLLVMQSLSLVGNLSMAQKKPFSVPLPFVTLNCL
jgi:hypothetical protein